MRNPSCNEYQLLQPLSTEIDDNLSNCKHIPIIILFVQICPKVYSSDHKDMYI